jgi:hypothetical protein
VTVAVWLCDCVLSGSRLSECVPSWALQ